MKRSLLIAAAAGAATAFLLPLPAPEPESLGRKFVIQETTSGERIASKRLPISQWPQSISEIAGMDREACLAALEVTLRYQATIPPPEQQQLAVALTLRLFDQGDRPGAEEFLVQHRLPAWLLAGVWMELTQQAKPIPGTLRHHLIAMPSGKQAALRIAAQLTATDLPGARAFIAAMPLDWHRALEESMLHSIAAAHPMEAAREAWRSGRDLREIALIAARRGPPEEAVQMLQHFAGDLESREIIAALGVLFARDPERTRGLIEAAGDEKLRAAMIAVAAQPDLEKDAARPLAALLREALQSDNADSISASRSLERMAAADPEAAKREWSALPDGKVKDTVARSLLQGLAIKDPASALQWAEEHCPSQSSFALDSWYQNDGPAALRAVLELSEFSEFRGRQLQMLDYYSRARIGSSQTRAARESCSQIISELPSKLQNIQLSPGRTLLEAYSGD